MALEANDAGYVASVGRKAGGTPSVFGGNARTGSNNPSSAQRGGGGDFGSSPARQRSESRQVSAGKLPQATRYNIT